MKGFRVCHECFTSKRFTKFSGNAKICKTCSPLKSDADILRKKLSKCGVEANFDGFPKALIGQLNRCWDSNVGKIESA